MSQCINSAQEYIRAIQQPRVVVIKCGANWCAPCKKIAPLYEYLAQGNNWARFYTLDIDEVPDFRDAELVTKLPTLFVFKNTRPVAAIVGTNLDIVHQELNKLRE